MLAEKERNPKMLAKHVVHSLCRNYHEWSCQSLLEFIICLSATKIFDTNEIREHIFKGFHPV